MATVKPADKPVKLTDTIVRAVAMGKFQWDISTRGFGVRVTAGGCRTFLFRYRNGDGKQCFLSLGRFGELVASREPEQTERPKSQTELAREKAEAARGQLVDGADPQADKRAAEVTRRTAPTVANLAEYYLGAYARHKGHTANTLAMNRVAMNRHILPKLGGLRVAEVTRGHIREVFGEARAAGEQAGHKGLYQANRVLAVMTSMFELARTDKEWRADNPCKGIDKYHEERRDRNLEAEEVGALLRACDSYEAGVRRSLRPLKQAAPFGPPSPEARSATDREAANAIRLLLYTGARLREVLNAEWTQFDLEAGVWLKPATHTKTKRPHRLELKGKPLRILRAMAECKSHDLYLFPGNPTLRRKNAPVDILTGEPVGVTPRHDLRRPWEAVCAMAELADLQRHDLRRTIASWLVSSGESLETTSRVLGHRDTRTTASYGFTHASVAKRALGAVGDALEATMQLPPPASATILQFTRGIAK